jgi:AcrR family transcriptional regulator
MTYMSQVDRRRQLIEAAIRVLQRDGIDQVTTRAIATEAGAPLASIHYTFGSKDEIVRAAFEQVITDLLAELEDGVTPGAGMQAAANDLCRCVGRLLDDPRFAIVMGDLTPASDPWAREQTERWNSSAERILRREADAAGETEPAIGFDRAGRLLVAGIDGLIMQFELHGDAATTRADLGALGVMVAGVLGPQT